MVSTLSPFIITASFDTHPPHRRRRSRRCLVEQRNRQVLPGYGYIETTTRLDVDPRDNRKDVHERALARCRSLQIPSSPGMFCRQQILEGLRRVFPSEGMRADDA